MSLTSESWAGSIRPGPVLAGLLLWASTALAEHYTLPLFMVPTTDVAATGVVRILNATGGSGTVNIYAVDDAGTRWGPATFTLHASAAAEFTAADLVSGNVMKGLTGGVGNLTGRLGAGVGKWRLTVSSDEPIQVVNVVSSTSGFVNNLSTTAIAGLAPRDHEAFNGRFADSGIEYRSFSVDFRDGPQGFVADFADLPATDTAIYELISGFGPLPSPLGPDEALFISGHNRSDGLFMFFRGQVGGLVPGARYNATVSVEIATDTPFGCVRTQEE